MTIQAESPFNKFNQLMIERKRRLSNHFGLIAEKKHQQNRYPNKMKTASSLITKTYKMLTEKVFLK